MFREKERKYICMPLKVSVTAWLYYISLNDFLPCNNNGFIITWIWHQIIMYSQYPIQHLYFIPSPSAEWTNWKINEFHVSNLNRRPFFPVMISTYILHPFLELSLEQEKLELLKTKELEIREKLEKLHQETWLEKFEFCSVLTFSSYLKWSCSKSVQVLE